MSEIRPNAANLGLNLNSSTSQKKEGELTYALNALLESWDGNRVNYQNEMKNTECVQFPKDFVVIGQKNVIEKDYTIFFLFNPITNSSEIGKVVNDTCEYTRILNADCLGWAIDRPIHKIHTKVTNCSTELYWADPLMRMLDLEDLPYKIEDNDDSCEPFVTNEVDCNKIKIQPNFSIPNVEYDVVDSGGNLVEGTYQFAIQYSNALGDPYTQYYGISNPISIFNPFKLTQDFNTVTDKSIAINIVDLDVTGAYEYINIIVIKTINIISSVELVETRRITDKIMRVVYTGESKSNIRLTIDDVKERFPVYESAGDSFVVQDVLGWADIKTKERISYQKIFNKVHLQWQTHKIDASLDRGYKYALNTANLRGYMRDEGYAFEGVLEFDDGSESDGFHIPNRPPTAYDLELISNNDTETGEKCEIATLLPRHKVYNTASTSGKIKECKENDGQNFGAGTIALICSDEGCTEQGGVTLKFTFDVATPEPISLLIGKITKDNSNNRVATGYEIYTLPAGVVADTYYGATAPLPFQVNIPAGVTEYTIAEPIYLQGLLGNSDTWICHNCLFPVTDLFLKAVTASNYKITFTSGQKIEVNNIYPDNPYIFGADEEEDCADDCYEGVYQWGEFAYMESTDLYPCEEEIWGELANQPIRHHKFPDSLVSHIHDDEGNIFPMGIRLDLDELKELIRDSSLTEAQKKRIVGVKIIRGDRSVHKSINAKGLLYNVGEYTKDKRTTFFPNYPFNDVSRDPFLTVSQSGNDSGENYDKQLEAYAKDDSKKRYTFLSPDTLFNQPSLGNTLKLETIEYGKSEGHIVQVKDHARYKFLTKGTYRTALTAAIIVGVASNEVGLSVKIFDGTAAYAAFGAVVNIIDKTTPRINFAYQSNSVGRYEKFIPVPNNGDKVRNTDIVTYLIPGNTSTGDIHPVNNFQRESSVYIRTTNTLPFPHEAGAPEDNSRWTLASERICDTWGDIVEKDISSYYASIKRNIANQYGAMYSYNTVDTGFRFNLDVFSVVPAGKVNIFGGDVFINRFGVKRKIPLFTDNRVKFADDSDIAYNDLNNVAYANYWMSTDYKGEDVDSGRQGAIGKLFGVKINNFDCRDDKKFYQRGKFYLFVYGISYFFVESDVNVDYRQAFNDKEGDFYPHVGEDIPDEWLQEVRTSINFDNTYFYNKTYSKQNKETLFTHLPPDFDSNCFYSYPNKAIYSDQQSDLINYKKNNWRIYRPLSQFDFPVNYGKLISIEPMENKAVLARFEDRSLIYNALLTINTSLPQQAYFGNDSLFKGGAPLDFAETETGHMGTQHKFYIRTKFGGVSVDAKRGQIFLVSGNKATDISGAEFKVDSFFKEHLDFEIAKAFPSMPLDNHFNGVGITGVYDGRFERLLITKLDYQPIVEGITYKDGFFFLKGKKISLKDETYFTDRSYTISFDFKNKVWVSFHSYIPNFYVGDAKSFLSGLNGANSSAWKHNVDITRYNNFYGKICPYILQYPFPYKINDEILQSVSDYTRVFKQIDETSFITAQDIYFNKAIIKNDEQCSGLLELVPKPKNARGYLQYPKYKIDSREILFTKSGNFYNYNAFWDVIKDYSVPAFTRSKNKLDEDLNQSNMNYTNKSYKKFPIRGKDVTIRHILDNTDEYRMISQFVITITQTSYK